VTDVRSFACHVQSVAAARRFVREVLRGRANDVVEAIELMVSELATNSVMHAHSAFEMTIDTSSGQVRVEVRDMGEGDPIPRTPSQYDVSGRGLQIVKALSDTWGVTPCRTGKTVWFVATEPDWSVPSAAGDPSRQATGPDGDTRGRPTLMVGRLWSALRPLLAGATLGRRVADSR
jgi:anti-sigma regulatory factor (Ser/Thr protein kinase)